MVNKFDRTARSLPIIPCQKAACTCGIPYAVCDACRAQARRPWACPVADSYFALSDWQRPLIRRAGIHPVRFCRKSGFGCSPHAGVVLSPSAMRSAKGKDSAKALMTKWMACGCRYLGAGSKRRCAGR